MAQSWNRIRSRWTWTSSWTLIQVWQYIAVSTSDRSVLKSVVPSPRGCVALVDESGWRCYRNGMQVKMLATFTHMTPSWRRTVRQLIRRPTLRSNKSTNSAINSLLSLYVHCLVLSAFFRNGNYSVSPKKQYTWLSIITLANVDNYKILSLLDSWWNFVHIYHQAFSTTP